MPTAPSYLSCGLKWKTSLIHYSTPVSRIFLLTCPITLGKCSLRVWFSTHNFLYTVLDNTTPLWVYIFKHFTHLVSLGIFYKCQKIAMWAWSHVWNLILVLLICSSHLQLGNFCRVLQKSPHTTTSPGQCITFRNFSITNREVSANTHWSGSHFELLSSQRIQAQCLKTFFMKLLHHLSGWVYYPSSHPLRSCSYVISSFLSLKWKIRGVHKNIFEPRVIEKNRATMVDIICLIPGFSPAP